jgi:hypothetical protein
VTERGTLQALAGRFPELLQTGGRALLDAADDPVVSRTLTAAWLRHETRSGLLRAPAPLAWETLQDDQRICGCWRHPIRWVRTSDSDLVCAVNGQSFSIPADPGILALIERLNTGDAFFVGDLIREHVGLRESGGIRFQASPEGIRTFLSKLRTLRAIT